MNAFEFDGKKYKKASVHQKEWGNALISEFLFRGDERILDLGCGDGVLTEQLALAVPNGSVLGIDASGGMIETAKSIVRQNLEFRQMDINELDFENEFDVIFSNAALHWVKDHKRLLKNAHRALKERGRLLWDFGGAGNCANFIAVARGKIKDEKYAGHFRDFAWPWQMPSKAEYEKWMSASGFSDFTIVEVNRDRYFSSEEEMIRWIDQPCLVPFLSCLPEGDKERFRGEVIAEMRERTRQPDDTYFETFRRLKIAAVRSRKPPRSFHFPNK